MLRDVAMSRRLQQGDEERGGGEECGATWRPVVTMSSDVAMSRRDVALPHGHRRATSGLPQTSHRDVALP